MKTAGSRYLLTSEEAAAAIGIRPNTLDQWRRRGRGPACVRPAGLRRVFYRPDDIAAWIEAGMGSGVSA